MRVYLHTQIGSLMDLQTPANAIIPFLSSFVLHYSSFCDATPCQSLKLHGYLCREVFKLPRKAWFSACITPPSIDGATCRPYTEATVFCPYPSRVGGRKLISLSLSLSLSPDYSEESRPRRRKKIKNKKTFSRLSRY